MTKPLPKDLTSYDLLKTLAVVLMIIDHAGYFFFPDDNWWRVAGRLCVPMWFFLIGYAQSRDLSPRLWIGAGILIVTSIVCGHYLFPLSILATMIVIRFIIDPFMRWALHSDFRFWLAGVLLFLLILPTNFIAEYGSQGLLLAMFGYLARNYQALGRKHDFVVNYALFMLFAFTIPQFFLHGLSTTQFYVLFIGSALVLYGLYNFRPAVIARKIPASLTKILQFTGRRTLEIYVAHIVLFQAVALLSGDERFGLFAWKFMPELS